MRILMLSQFYPPIIGGEEYHVRSLSTMLSARGHEVAVATIWHKGLPDFEIDQDVRIYRIRGTVQRMNTLFSDLGHKHAPPFPDPELTGALRQVIIREQPEIIHAHNWLIHSFLPLKGWSDAKLVLSIHDHSIICPKKKLIYQDAPCSGPALIKCLRCASEHYQGMKGVVVAGANFAMSAVERAMVDMFIPVSRSVAIENRLLDHALPVQVIPNFLPDDIDVPLTESLPCLEQLPDGEYMLFVGAFASYKGIDVLTEAYSTLANTFPLVIIGYETSEYPVQTTNFPTNVVLLKNWTHRAVMEAWRRSSIALIPSIWSEPFGIVALEAMAMERPVIASRIGGLSDVVVDNETGLLVPPGDVEALRQAIERLVADPELRAKMGQAGKKKVSEFRASTIVPRIEGIYEAVLKCNAKHIVQVVPQ